MPQSATTDTRGRFSITYKPQFTGSIVMRVVVDPAGRYLAVTGQPNPVRLLALSSINLKGGGTIPTNTAIKFTVAVDPPSTGRTVRIEQSSDKVRWVPVGPSGKTKTDGTSVLSVPAPAVGAWYYRATVAQDDKFAAAVSPTVGATVEDIKAAAATYIAITNRFNAANDAFNTATGNASTVSGVPAASLAAARAYSAAYTKNAAELRAYGEWPQSVKPLIDQIIAQDVIAADGMHQMSAASDWVSWNGEYGQFYTANSEAGRLSAQIRQALGLPQRKAG